MKILCVHAHFDDFEFVAAGTFELWRRRLGKSLKAKVVVCTDSAAGHHFRTRKETARVRLAEQRASARIGGYEFELLRLPTGGFPREGAAHLTTGCCAAFWKVIRDFEPDYLFCPPFPTSMDRIPARTAPGGSPRSLRLPTCNGVSCIIALKSF